MSAPLAGLSDQELVRRLQGLVKTSNEITAELLSHMGEVDARELYLDEACPSMFVYCTTRLRMSEQSAFKRIRAARASREFPIIVEMVASGEIHLAGVALLSPHLTPANHARLLSEASHKSKREIELLVAEWFPSPDARSSIRKLPDPRRSADGGQPTPTTNQGERDDSASQAKSPDEGALQGLLLARTSSKPACTVTPTAPQRFKVQFTADQELHDKLRQARDLLRHQVPDGDLAQLFDRALTLLVDDLKRKKLGKARADKAQPASRTDTG